MTVRSYMLVLVCCCAMHGWCYQGVPSLTEDSRRSPIFLGCSLMGGARSNYVYRGWKLGEQVGEAQFAVSGALSNDWAFAGEMDFLRGFSGRKVSQSTLSGELMYYIGEECTLGVSVGHNWFSRTVLESGMENGIHLRWSPTADWYIHSFVVYDEGQKGFYGQAAVTWQPLVRQSTAWATTVALGAGSTYHHVSGMQDLMVRTGPLIRLGPDFRLQPFVAYYQGLAHDIDNHVSIGAWITWCF